MAVFGIEFSKKCWENQPGLPHSKKWQFSLLLSWGTFNFILMSLLYIMQSLIVLPCSLQRSVIFCSLSSWRTFGLSWSGCRLLASLLRAWVFDTGLQEEFKSSGIPTRQRPGFPWALSKGYFSAWSGNSKCAEEAHDTDAGRLHKGPTRKTSSWGAMQVLHYFYFYNTIS